MIKTHCNAKLHEIIEEKLKFTKFYSILNTYKKLVHTITPLRNTKFAENIQYFKQTNLNCCANEKYREICKTHTKSTKIYLKYTINIFY